jgi:Na+-transporting NADH:ubiquinone oxidoreductase subunit NqrC
MRKVIAHVHCIAHVLLSFIYVFVSTASTSQPKASTEIDDIFSKKKPASEIDDIFAKKPVEQKGTDGASSASSDHKSGKGKMEAAEDEADDSQAVEEVVFAELAAVKASRKRASQPKIADDDGFGDSRGKKSSTSIIKLIFRFTPSICESAHYLFLYFVFQRTHNRRWLSPL